MTFDTNFFVILVVVLAAAIALFLLVRGRRAPKVERKPAEPYVASQDRPYVKKRKDGPEGNGVADEVAAATTDVAGEVLGVDAHRELGDAKGPADDLSRLKGVGPKFAARLQELGVTRYAQLAGSARPSSPISTSGWGLSRPPRPRPGRRAGRLSRPRRHDGFEASSASSGLEAPGSEHAAGRAGLARRAICRSCGRPCRPPRTASRRRRSARRLRAYASAPTGQSRRRSHSRGPPAARCRAGRTSVSAGTEPETHQLPSSRSTNGGSAPNLGVGGELAGDRGEQVGGRHQPFEMAIFVMDERDRDLGGAQHLERVHRVHLVGNDRRRRDQRAQVERPAVEQGATRSRAWTTPISGSTEPSADRQPAVRRRERSGRAAPRRRRRDRSSRPRCAASSPRAPAGRRGAPRRR